MDKQVIEERLRQFVNETAENFIKEQDALSPQLVGMRIYDEPIVGIGKANDELFTIFKKPDAVGEIFMDPEQWLPGAKSVISYFLPFSEEVRKGNRNDMSWPSPGWLHGRLEGQTFLVKVSNFIKEMLEVEGHQGSIPIIDSRFRSGGMTGLTAGQGKMGFTSNWSERHVAYVCGLGTFCLSKGLITEKGVAGRFGSVITDLELPADNRNYEGIYDYCNNCGVCVKNCPANAISLEKGKNHDLCFAFLQEVYAQIKPRYACGKCQVKVPCENRIP